SGCNFGNGGRGGIRTHGRFNPSPVFKTGAFNRSATLPETDAVGRHLPALQNGEICSSHRGAHCRTSGAETSAPECLEFRFAAGLAVDVATAQTGVSHHGRNR